MRNSPRTNEELAPWLGHRGNHVFLCCATTIAFVAVVLVEQRGTVLVDAATPPPPAERRLNPNTAQWWELAELPGLGESLARRIVAYRQYKHSSMSDTCAIVFRRWEDLQRVRGIGPAKAAAIEPWLAFPDHGKD